MTDRTQGAVHIVAGTAGADTTSAGFTTDVSAYPSATRYTKVHGAVRLLLRDHNNSDPNSFVIDFFGVNDTTGAAVTDHLYGKCSVGYPYQLPENGAGPQTTFPP